MTTRAEFVQKARAAGLDSGRIKAAMVDRRARVGAFDDDPGAVPDPAPVDTTPTAPPRPAAPTGASGSWETAPSAGDRITEAARYVIPSRVEYGEKHPGRNSIKGQILGPSADPSITGTASAWAEDASSFPRRLAGGATELAKAGYNKLNGDPAATAEALAAAKREMQKTEGDGVVETVARELPLMFIPGGQGRGGANIAAKVGTKAIEKAAPEMVAEGALPLKDWIVNAAAEAPAKVSEAAAAVPGMATRALGGMKRLGTDMLQKMGRSAAATVPQAVYHQAKSVQETGQLSPGEGAAEVAAGGLVPIPLKALGGAKRLVPQGAKWLMSQFSGAPQAALQRAAEKGGMKALRSVAGDGSADVLADELITTLGNKEPLLHPEAKNAEEIATKLPHVQAVEPMTRRNTRAFQNGQEIPIDFNRPLEPIPRANVQPTPKEAAEFEKMAQASGEQGLPGGNQKYEEAARQFRTDAADRTKQAATLSQTVKEAMRSVGKKIYVTDAMRSQLGLSGSRWKNNASEFGLDMFTSNKAEGVGLDKAAMMIGADQAAGRWAGLPKIENEGDLLDALYESTVKKTRGRSDLDKFLQEAIKTGENLGPAEKMPAGSLGRGDIFTVGGSHFKVLKNADGQVIIDGPVKHIMDARDQVHFDAGSRLSNNGEIFSPVAVSESMDAPEPAKLTFVKTLERGRERFRDILEKKVAETARTPEKEKTIAKLDRLLTLADEQLQGRETLSAQEAIAFKRDYQDVLAEQFKSRESNEYFGLYKRLSHALRTGIEEAAEKSGNAEYISTMRSLANKMNTIDRVESRFVGEQLNKAQDKAARQIKIINNDAQRPAMKELQALDNLFGTNFTERAKDISFARMLNMSPEGGVPLLPLHTTGKALMGASALGGAYKAKDGEVNPFAVAGLLLSSPRLAIYAFKALDKTAAAGPVARKLLGPALPRLGSTGIYESNKQEQKP